MTVAINAELRAAGSDWPLEVDDEVCVIGVKGLKLRVEPASER